MQRALSPSRQRLNRTILEARRTRAGLPPSRLRGLSSFGGFGAAALAVPAAWQVDPNALRSLAAGAASGNVPTAVLQPKPSAAPAVIAAAPQAVAATRAAWSSAALPSAINFRGFGSFGLSPTADTAVSAVGSKAAAVGTTSLLTSLGTSAAIAGPIGIAAGVVIALAVTLFKKNYFNVGDSNAACAQLESLWQKYTSIQGHVAGRALGWQTMNQLMHAATGAGLFPGNNMHLSFHEGTLQCAGHGDWVDSFTGYTIQGNKGSACGAHNCLPDAFTTYQGQRNAVPPGTPDAVFLVDNILLPMNAPGRAQIPWIYQGAQNLEVHQLLYDLADAYIAQFGSGGDTPYVEYPAAQVGTPIANAEGAPAGGTSPAPAGGTSPASPAGGMPAGVPAAGGIPAGWTQVGTNPLNGAPLIAQPGNPQVYQWANGQATPYTGATTTVPQTATSTTPVQVGTDPTTGLPFYSVPGQSGYFQIVNGQLQPYSPTTPINAGALTPQSAVPTYAPTYPSTPDVSGATSTQGTAPAGATAALATGAPLGGMSTSTLAIVGGSIVGIYLITEMLEKRKKAKGKKS